MKPFNNKKPIETTEFKPGDYGLHGDVILERVDLPKDFDSMPEVKDHCLAYGEATGHAHKIFGEPKDFELRECSKTKTRYLRVLNDVCLKHQEHDPVMLKKGDYKTGIQREYDPFEKLTRRVID